jgi:amidase
MSAASGTAPARADGSEPQPLPVTATGIAATVAGDPAQAPAFTARALARIAQVDPTVHAFLTVDTVGATAAARAIADDPITAGGLGPLAGVPVAIKDLTDTAGLRTTYGSLHFADHVPQEDDLVVARLRRAGAVIVGKTMTPEFGFGAICGNRLGGPTCNPFDLRLTSSGSSGGAAVAVATGMVPIAHGTDFGGSVRTPASFCGVLALRPTPGALPNPRRALAYDMLSTHGFLARTVDDLALAFEAVAGPDPRDPLSLGACGAPATVPAPATATGALRIAATQDFGVAPVARAVRSGFERAVASVEAAVGPLQRAHPDCTDAIETFHVLRPPLIHAAYAALHATEPQRLTPTVRWWIERGAEARAADWLAAEARRTALMRRFVGFFEHFDVLMAPAAALLPWPNTETDVRAIDDIPMPTLVDYLAITFVVSLVGCPVVTLPATTVGGLPVGVQLIGAPGSDRALLAMARRFERDAGMRFIASPLSGDRA